MKVGSPGAAAATAADKTQLQQKQPHWKHDPGALDDAPLGNSNDFSSQSDQDRVQQALTQRLAKLLQPPA